MHETTSFLVQGREDNTFYQILISLIRNVEAVAVYTLDEGVRSKHYNNCVENTVKTKI